MFVRKKTIKGKPHFYLVENTRHDGKVKQKVLAYLGDMDTIAGAIAQRERWLKSYNEGAIRWAGKVKELEDLHAQILRSHGLEPKPFPKPARGLSSGVYQYARYQDTLQKYKQRIYETETQLDKLKFYL